MGTHHARGDDTVDVFGPNVVSVTMSFRRTFRSGRKKVSDAPRFNVAWLARTAVP
jgi:hypothetical protein